MSERNNSGMGAGRTAVGLLGLGVASTLCGALVLGPMLGKQMTRRPRAAAQAAGLPGVSSQVPSTVKPPAEKTPAPMGLDAPDPVETEPSAPPAGLEAGTPPGIESPVHEALQPNESELLKGAGRSVGEELATETSKRKAEDEREVVKPQPVTPVTPPGGDRKTGTAADKTPAATASRGHSAAPATGQDTPRETRPDTGLNGSGTGSAGSGGRETASEKPVEMPFEEPGAGRTSPDGQTEPTPEAIEAPRVLYRVRVGRYKTRDEADALREEVAKAAGVPASVVQIGEEYRLQVGAYRQKNYAERLARKLRSRNYQTDVSPDQRP
jgi:cell division protein FtsN